MALNESSRIPVAKATVEPNQNSPQLSNDSLHDVALKSIEQRRVSDRYLAHIKVTKCDQLKTLLVEEAPDNEKMKYYSGMYLIHDVIICIWLIVCVMFEDDK